MSKLVEKNEGNPFEMQMEKEPELQSEPTKKSVWEKTKSILSKICTTEHSVIALYIFNQEFLLRSRQKISMVTFFLIIRDSICGYIAIKR